MSKKKLFLRKNDVDRDGWKKRKEKETSQSVVYIFSVVFYYFFEHSKTIIPTMLPCALIISIPL